MAIRSIEVVDRRAAIAAMNRSRELRVAWRHWQVRCCVAVMIIAKVKAPDRNEYCLRSARSGDLYFAKLNAYRVKASSTIEDIAMFGNTCQLCEGQGRAESLNITEHAKSQGILASWLLSNGSPSGTHPLCFCVNYGFALLAGQGGLL